MKPHIYRSCGVWYCGLFGTYYIGGLSPALAYDEWCIMHVVI
jgi:hypothetical protein